MTASSTPCSPRRTDRRRFILHGLAAWLAGVSLTLACLCGDVCAAGIELRDFSLSQAEEGYEVNASMAFEIPLALANLVERGVVLSFKAELEIHRPRWYWFDERVARKAQTVRLSYHALTRQYRVAIGDLQQSFPTLQDAERQLARLHRWLVAERKDLKPGVPHRVTFRYFLDTTELPKPLQLTAFTSSGWDLSAPLVQVSYTPMAEGK